MLLQVMVALRRNLEALSKYDLALSEAALKDIIRKYHRLCLHCDKIPSLLRMPLHSIPHGQQPNEVLHSDYLKVDSHYLLTLIDDFTRKISIRLTKSPNVETVVQSLLFWKANFGLKDEFILCTDQGSHFCNKVLQAETKLEKKT